MYARKRATVWSLPEAIILHLKRFGTAGRKLCNPVHFAADEPLHMSSGSEPDGALLPTFCKQHPGS